MKLRFPLYAKILLWFFLNLAVLATALLFLVRAQFGWGLDWMLAAGAGHRLQVLSDLVVAELRERPRGDWGSVLKRFSEAHQLEFYLFQDHDGAQLSGEPVQLPPAVRARMVRPRLPAMQPRPPAQAPGLPPLRDRADRPLPGGLARSENPKFIVRSLDPMGYWALVRVGLQEPGLPRPMPATLVIRSATMSGGGLFFDYKPWLALGAAAVVISLLLWLPLVRGITHSIGQMTTATRHIAEGRFDGRVDERRRDELGSLGRSINRMAARLSGFVMGQKRFLGDIAHELCAPIARIQVALGILEQRADDKSRPYVEDLREEVEQMSRLVNELLCFSKASLGAATVKLQPVSVSEAVEQARKRETPDASQARVEIPGDLQVMAEPELLVRALSNLLRNAVRYAGQAGPITVSARPEGKDVVVTVADSGPGVPEAELERIFDPFYRLDASRDASTGGVGLGLAIVKTCVDSCRGTVTCRNRQPSGLEVTLRLPAASSE